MVILGLVSWWESADYKRATVWLAQSLLGVAGVDLEVVAMALVGPIEAPLLASLVIVQSPAAPVARCILAGLSAAACLLADGVLIAVAVVLAMVYGQDSWPSKAYASVSAALPAATVIVAWSVLAAPVRTRRRRARR